MILVAGLVTGGAALAAALIVFGPKLQQLQPSVPVATAPPVAPLVAPASPTANSGAAKITVERWESYVNDRYGVIVEYRSDLFEIQPPATRQCRARLHREQGRRALLCL